MRCESRQRLRPAEGLPSTVANNNDTGNKIGHLYYFMQNLFFLSIKKGRPLYLAGLL
jgi:hypothetical protein